MRTLTTHAYILQGIKFSGTDEDLGNYHTFPADVVGNDDHTNNDGDIGDEAEVRFNFKDFTEISTGFLSKLLR